jgi:hypothetical protein
MIEDRMYADQFESIPEISVRFGPRSDRHTTEVEQRRQC